MLDTRPGAERLRGYRDELQALGLAYRDEYVGYGDFYVESGRAGVRTLLALDEPPTAIVRRLGHDGDRRDPRRGRAPA